MSRVINPVCVYEERHGMHVGHESQRHIRNSQLALLHRIGEPWRQEVE